VLTRNPGRPKGARSLSQRARCLTRRAISLHRLSDLDKGQIILALSNPDPEIEPALALQNGAAFAADGKGIHNVLAFPGLFKGALAANAQCFTDAMLIAAARSIAARASGDDLVPDPLNRDVHQAVAAAVQAAV
jgi:malate dehydrogenase (oxaloacetate-decarboxylating)